MTHHSEMNLERFRYDVSFRMLTVYGIDWKEACGEDVPLLQAIDEGETAEEFVDWFGRKFDLDPLWLFGLEPPHDRITRLSQTMRGNLLD